jgi:hypothetical protein
VDASPIVVEKQDAKITYKGFREYHSLMGALKEFAAVLKEEFREGNEHPGARAVASLEDYCFLSRG